MIDNLSSHNTVDYDIEILKTIPYDNYTNKQLSKNV